jgi:protein-tyrosine phosphatase
MPAQDVPVDLVAPAPVGVVAAPAERSIAFGVVFNVRDLGGLPTADGRSVRPRQLFRADGVHRLDGDDLELARTLELRTVVDLRTAEEVARGRFPLERVPVEWHHLPLMRRMWSEDDLKPSDGAARFLAERYLAMVEQSGQTLGRAVELLAAGTPALFHCAAGKDRTGVVAAFVLGLLGVAPDDIAADYHESAANMAAFQAWIRDEHPEAADAMTQQPPEYLDAPPEAMFGFLEAIDHRHGSMEGLAHDLGIGGATITRLRATLLA